MKKFMLLIGLVLVMLGCTQTQTQTQAIWIDVRTVQEYEAGHLPTAVNIPFDVIADNISAVTTDKNAPIHLYCKSGRRAGVALETLSALGYTNVTNEGGYEQLIAD
ncbi:rhodanese-like domain-containing protein [Rheinheimera sp. WS51]|uniref:rhodanese-like domain-containing protein n=1 Tax=Rheinheimera sp. WS51 TaxID=3425886 RepID=UPI003D8C94DC